MNHKLKQEEQDKMLIKHMSNEPSYGEKFQVEEMGVMSFTLIKSVQPTLIMGERLWEARMGERLWEAKII
jgi:hypothetical protein